MAVPGDEGRHVVDISRFIVVDGRSVVFAQGFREIFNVGVAVVSRD